ncbi:MAG: gamma-glutamyl-gamma-aminobutyrate hydrolase family protein [Armatimonadetes bacterium]|nr:gamma-glutamyl-gamma-aminobutyrate hydrolase family protein [Armatimonadota bacterium]
MSKPVIGIVCSIGPDPVMPEEREVFFVGKPYVDRLIEAGAIPLLIPHGIHPRESLDLIDGWMIIGGNDIDPARFGQDVHPETKMESTERFEAEKKVYDAVPKDMPVLGICYGCQFLNVVNGGDLVQHVPDVVGHGGHAGGTMQDYSVAAGSTTASALGSTSVQGKSYHHQAVGQVGDGLKVVARSEDGTVEAIEATDGRWILGIQWHPERTPADPASRSLFNEFVRKATEYKENKASCGTW